MAKIGNEAPVSSDAVARQQQQRQKMKGDEGTAAARKLP